ncbi:MAG: hypothetical protein WC101_00460 [Candidatus Gracilibacteria bacterium]
MIDETLKIELLKELEKAGNILIACQKVGISRATFYRWKETDKDFKKKATRAERLGRESSNDIAEYGLLKGAKEGKIEHIKYLLSHNSKRYKPNKSDKVIIEHRSGPKASEEPKQTIEDFIDIMTSRNEEEAAEMRVKYEKMGPLPLKSDGTPISNEEIGMYEGFIIEYFKKKKAEDGS